ncbi:non-ribosomal peptide synthetase [Streptomyces orinoci]|uniref:Non-ribosomal peptide synthetase n=1 Tax=Streptomyces orinoci TaxID=67339 RepID=A0ABV3K0R6_STRON|nr:non-ribosomal peptide synthetase [Streptomyces orinoci]
MQSPSSHSITASYLAGYRRIAEQAADPGQLLPVTGAQRRFLLARRLDPGQRPALVPLFFAFPRGALDLARLRAAAGHLAALHPALRTVPEVPRGVPVQRIGTAGGWLRRVTAGPGERAGQALLRELDAWSAEGPPLRLWLAADGEREVLALVLDHGSCDEHSLGLVTDGLAAAYANGLGPAEVPSWRAEQELAAYREAVHLQLTAEQRASAPGFLAYWGKRLSVLAPPPPPPPSGSGQDTGSFRHRLPLPPGGARTVAFPALLDACTRAVRRLHGGRRVPALGYPWGGRPAGAPPVLGCFLNTVVHPAGDEGPEERTAAWWDDLDHADTPFDQVVHAARCAGAPWSGGLDGLLTFEDLHRRPPLRLGEAVGEEIFFDARPLPAPLAVSVSYGTDLLVRMAWRRTVLPAGPAEEAFTTLIDALAASVS